MKLASGVLLALVLAALPGIGAPALPDAATVVKMMLAAPTLVDYQGTKVVTAVRGTSAETVTILESYKRLGRLRLEFLSPESVSGRLIVDDGATAWQYEPSLHLVVRGPSFVEARGGLAHAAEVMLRYRATVAGIEDVIGRETVLLHLVSLAEGVRRQYWVDRVNGVVLRAEERDARGELIYASFFTRISYGLNLPSALFRFNFPSGAKFFSFYLSGDPVRTPQELVREAKFATVAPPTLWRGYHFRDGSVAHYGAFTASVATYTDGVHVLTVFQTPSSRMALPSIGARVALEAGVFRGRAPEARLLDLGYFRILSWQARGVNFAVAGSVPAQVLTAIARELNAANP